MESKHKWQVEGATHTINILLEIKNGRQEWSLVLFEDVKVGGFLGFGGDSIKERVGFWPSESQSYPGSALEVLCDSLGWFQARDAEDVYLQLPCGLMAFLKRLELFHPHGIISG